MAANQNLHETAEAWAEITIKEFMSKIDKFRIGNYDARKKSPKELSKYGRLRDSFVQEVVTKSNGDLQKITLAYWYWGAMVDMGVGKGTRLGDVSENSFSRRTSGRRTGNRRRPKKWYSKTIEREVFNLGRIMAEKYGIRSTDVVLKEMPQNIHINL